MLTQQILNVAANIDSVFGVLYFIFIIGPLFGQVSIDLEISRGFG